MAKYPADVQAIADAVFAVARRVIDAEESHGVYPSEPLTAPVIEATPAFARVSAGAFLDELEVLALRILVAEEVDRGVHRAACAGSLRS